MNSKKWGASSKPLVAPTTTYFSFDLPLTSFSKADFTLDSLWWDIAGNWGIKSLSSALVLFKKNKLVSESEFSTCKFRSPFTRKHLM